MIRVLRLMEYEYPDNETAEDDMARWYVPHTGSRLIAQGTSRERVIRSTTMINLDVDDAAGGER